MYRLRGTCISSGQFRAHSQHSSRGELGGSQRRSFALFPLSHQRSGDQERPGKPGHRTKNRQRRSLFHTSLLEQSRSYEYPLVRPCRSQSRDCAHTIARLRAHNRVHNPSLATGVEVQSGQQSLGSRHRQNSALSTRMACVVYRYLLRGSTGIFIPRTNWLAIGEHRHPHTNNIFELL